MPDHCHFAFELLEGSLSGLMASFSKFTAREIHGLLGEKGPFWQAGFYDHAMRGEKTLRGYLEYMAHNPVRARLVATPDEWPFTSIGPKW